MSALSERIDGLIGSLAREEKLRLVRGDRDPEGTATGFVPGVPRLDIPALRLVDGPLGIRIEGERTTAFPASIAAAATFDPALVKRQGAALAREATAHGQDVLLAPALNLIRVPQCGRIFEYYAEDPILTARFAASAVEGIQSESVIATPKHYVANNQETDRPTVSAEVGERALRELYLPGFHDAVTAGARAVMTAYNRVNGIHMSDHHTLVTEVLKEEWDFPGFAVSDWWGTASTVGAATGGLDLEMPGMPPEGFTGIEEGDADALLAGAGTAAPGLLAPVARGLPDPSTSGRFGKPLEEAIEAGEVPEERLDDMVARILGAMEWAGRLDGERGEGALDTAEHRQLARELAARGIVLLENDGILPLAADASVALIGPNVDEVTVGGGGSSETEPFAPVTTAEGIRRRAEGPVTVAQGLPRITTPSFFDLIMGRSTPGQAGGEPDLEAAGDVAASADVAVVVVRDWMTEGADKDSLALPGDQDDLVRAVAAANDRTVVVVQSGGPVELPWRDDVAAVLEAWYPGQADGAALASVLYGDIDASGRLPVTFAEEDQYPTSDPEAFPGEGGEVHYHEGVFVGYRHFDAAGIDPMYPFGHGESFASVRYRDAAVADERRVGVTLENESSRVAREVVQAYVRAPQGRMDRPIRELAGFVSVDLQPGERVTAEVGLDERSFAYWDGGWTIEPGTYTVEIGRSSRDPRLRREVER